MPAIFFGSVDFDRDLVERERDLVDADAFILDTERLIASLRARPRRRESHAQSIAP